MWSIRLSCPEAYSRVTSGPILTSFEPTLSAAAFPSTNYSRPSKMGKFFPRR